MSEVERACVTTTAPLSKAGESTRLTGQLGMLDIVFTVLAYNAPLTVVIGLIPIMVSMGNGLGAPVTFLASGGLMLLFAVGFSTMSRHVPNAGAYYAYITVGLGRPLGLGSAMVAILAYAFFLVGTYLYAGVVFTTFLSHALGHSPLTWQQFALVIWLVVSVLGHFRISLSAKVMTVALILEVLVVFVWEISVAAAKGTQLSAVWLTPEALRSGSVALAVLFGVTCFAGFEATAVFREEARDPEVTVPRATYVSIIVMTVIFASATYFFIVGYGPSAALARSAAAPSTASLDNIGMFLGKVGLNAVSALTCTSIFACLLALHNILARYIYSLSSDAVFPKALCGIHAKHGSPYKASLVVSSVALCAVIVLVSLDVDAYAIYACLVGMAGYALLLLQILTSLAVIVFFGRSSLKVGVWKTRYIPAVSLVGLVVTFWFATSNVEELTGNLRLALMLLASVFLFLLFGMIFALVLKRREPRTYAAIGRQTL
jgi:amino acid transporter